jgi:pseudouridine-5'-phosphate glycosidase/pseudouridine kinase
MIRQGVSPSDSTSKLAVIGAAALDITSRAALQSDSTLDANSTTPGSVIMTFGGVARNIAESAHRILSKAKEGGEEATLLIAPIASDATADLIRSDMVSIGLKTQGLVNITAKESHSATCVMRLDRGGDLENGIADMDITRDLQFQQVGLSNISRKMWLTILCSLMIF